jgi:hypothetical protein
VVQKVANPAGQAPVTVDFALKRGVFVRGRVTDKATGKPVQVSIEYFVFADNPFRQGAGGLTGHVYHRSGSDGSYRLVALPGRGIVACRAWGDHYIMAVGADKIAGRNEQGSFITYPFYCFASNYHTLAEVNPDKGAESVTCNLVLDPGRTLTGTVRGPDGKPLAGARVLGLKDMGYWEHAPLATADFRLLGLRADKPRTVIFLHEGKKLAGFREVRPDEKGPVEVRLQPWGVITGRLLDADGRPWTGVRLIFFRSGGSLPGRGIRPDHEGKFRLEGLAAGLKYSLDVLDKGNMLAGQVFHDVTVKAGETKDLGDVKAK